MECYHFCNSQQNTTRSPQGTRVTGWTATESRDGWTDPPTSGALTTPPITGHKEQQPTRACWWKATGGTRGGEPVPGKRAACTLTHKPGSHQSSQRNKLRGCRCYRTAWGARTEIQSEKSHSRSNSLFQLINSNKRGWYLDWKRFNTHTNKINVWTLFES